MCSQRRSSCCCLATRVPLCTCWKLQPGCCQQQVVPSALCLWQLQPVSSHQKQLNNLDTNTSGVSAGCIYQSDAPASGSKVLLSICSTPLVSLLWHLRELQPVCSSPEALDQVLNMSTPNSSCVVSFGRHLAARCSPANDTYFAVVHVDSAFLCSLSSTVVQRGAYTGLKPGMRVMILASTKEQVQAVQTSRDLPGLAGFDHELKLAARRRRGTNKHLTLPSGKRTGSIARMWQLVVNIRSL